MDKPGISPWQAQDSVLIQAYKEQKPPSFITSVTVPKTKTL
tara:strand:+ start:279 stop:401 length:123 start_codon:yes stop_codon:yes gene_type:complete